MKENFKNLQKLKLKKIELNHNSIYSYLQQNIKNNIESLYINKCGECCLNQFPICPNMIKFIIKNTKIKKNRWLTEFNFFYFRTKYNKSNRNYKNK